MSSFEDMLSARLQYQNRYDGHLSASCYGSSGMYRISSVYSRKHKDRVWNWECRHIGGGFPNCHKAYNYVNDFDQPMFFMCGKDQYIGGVESYHSNKREDRRWKFTCCSIPSHSTKSCRLTGFVNHFQANFNFVAGANEVITGVFSYHHNGHE